MKHVLSGLAVLILLVTCAEREWNSPYDPNATDRSSWAPLELRIIQDTDTSMTLSWERADDRVDGFRLYRMVGSSDWEVLDERLDGNRNTQVLDVVELGSPHGFKLAALADESVSQTVEVQLTPSFPAVIITDVADFDGLDSLEFSWRAHDFPSVQEYLVERQVGDGGYETLASVGTELSYRDRDLDTSLTYSYRIIARSLAGNRSDSTATRSIDVRYHAYEPSWGVGVQNALMAISPDDQVLYMCNYDQIQAIDPADGQLIWSKAGSQGNGFNYMDLSPDGSRLLLTGGNDVGLQLLQASSGYQVWKKESSGYQDYRYPRFNPDGTAIYTAHYSRLSKYDLDGEFLWGSGIVVGGWAVSNDDSQIFFNGVYDTGPHYRVGLLSALDGALTWQDTSLNDDEVAYIGINTLGWNDQAGDFWASGSAWSGSGGWMRSWSSPGSLLNGELFFDTGFTMLKSPDEAYYYGSTGIESVHKIDASTLELLWSVENSGGRSLTITSDGQLLAAGSQAEQKLRILDAGSGEVLYERDLPGQWVSPKMFSGSGDRLFLTGDTTLVYRRAPTWYVH